MRNLAFILVVFYLVSSCDKAKQVNRKIEGNWYIESIRTQEASGLSYFTTDDSGIFQFISNGKKSTSGTFTINSSFSYDGKELMINEKGTYQLSSNNIERILNNGDVYSSTIVYVNRDNCEFEFHDASLSTYFFRLKKN